MNQSKRNFSRVLYPKSNRTRADPNFFMRYMRVIHLTPSLQGEWNEYRPGGRGEGRQSGSGKKRVLPWGGWGGAHGPLCRAGPPLVGSPTANALLAIAARQMHFWRRTAMFFSMAFRLPLPLSMSSHASLDSRHEPFHFSSWYITVLNII